MTSVERRVEARRDVSRDPGEVVGAEAGAGDDVEMVVGKARDGQVAFDAAARVEHLRVGRAGPAAWRRRWRQIQRQRRRRRPCPRISYLAKDDWSKSADALAHRPVLVADRVEPVAAGRRNRRRAARRLRGANQFGRSQPSFEPKTARCAFSRS